jgi:hypothetical protein
MDAIQVTGEEIVKVRKSFKVKEGDIKRDVEIILDWLKQQQHLPKIEGTSIIVSTKGQVKAVYLTGM